jgi:glycosyltransferase involved in cell wall biosynthesis
VYAREVALALAAEGHEVSVWCPPGDGGGAVLARAAKNWPFRVFPISGNGGRQGWRDRCSTLRHWRARADEVLASHLLVAEPGALRAACLAELLRLARPARLSVMLHGSEILYLSRFPHRRWLLERLLGRADSVCVHSRFNATLLLERFRGVSGKLRVIPGALRSDFWGCLGPGGDLGRRAGAGAGSGEGVDANVSATCDTGGTAAGAPGPAVDEAVVCVVCVGRIHPRKGQHALLEAAALLPGEIRRRARFCFAGRVVDPAYQRRLDVLAARSGAHVEFCGEIPDEGLARFYSDADVFVLPSQPTRGSVEGFGLVCLEAGAFGLPVVAHDTGGISDAVRDGETGLLVPHNDRQALADALSRLISMPALRRRMGGAGRRHAASFTWRDYARALIPPVAPA